MANRELVSFDFAMKYILRQKDNFEILEGFLTALLEDDVTVIEIIESESNKEATILKGNRVDLMIKDSKDRRMIVEIQHAAETHYFERMIFETSKTIVDNLEKGKYYGDIVKVISINILYFDLGEGDGDLYKGTIEFKDMRNQTTLKYETNKLPEYYIIRTKKFNDEIKTALDEWLYMFKNSEVKEECNSKGIKLAKERLDVLKMDDKQRRAYDRFIHERRIEGDVMATAEERGRAEGIKEGIEKGRLEEKMSLVKSLLDILDDDTIALKTGLALEQVQKLRHN